MSDANVLKAWIERLSALTADSALATESERARAHGKYVDASAGCIAIDDDALASRADDGTVWVQAWVQLEPAETTEGAT